MRKPIPVSSVRRSTARLPSNAREPLALAVTDPLSAVVFASKLPPIVIGQITRTSPGPTRHVSAATTVAPARTRPTSVDFTTGPQRRRSKRSHTTAALATIPPM